MAHRPFLVFTSAGEKCNVLQWVDDRSYGVNRDEIGGAAVAAPRDWELCVAYYGEEADPACLRVADRGLRLKGGKVRRESLDSPWSLLCASEGSACSRRCAVAVSQPRPRDAPAARILCVIRGYPCRGR